MKTCSQLVGAVCLLHLASGCATDAPAPVPTQPSAPPEPSDTAIDQPPPKTPTPATTPARTTVFAAGDVYLGGYIRGRVREKGIDHPFARLKDTIEAHDLAFANLEAPISSRGTRINTTKKPLFRITREAALPLTRSGLDVMSVANNHTMDYLEDSFTDTLDTMEEFGIATTGGGRTRQEASIPFVYEKDGTRIAILAYNGILMSQMAVNAYRPGMNPLRIEKIVEDIQKIPEDTVVLVSVHWGEQYVEEPRKKHMANARRMIEAGADAILGHHPHCPQKIEVYQGKPIFYSLGNFVFGINPPKGRHNIAASLVIEDGAVTEASILPVHGMFFACDYSPYFLTGEEAAKVVDNLAHISEGLATIQLDGDRGLIDLSE